jgi:membrane-associated protease RseP (regulator of RpoE activity)
MIGTGTTPGIESLVTVLGTSAGLKIKTIAGMTDGFGGSDHQSFYAKDVPVLFAFTGVHQDYHRPTDDADRINYRGMGRIADYLELILLDVIRRPERPALIKMAQQPRRPRAGGAASKASADPARSGSSVTMGSMPDYEYTAGGMKLAGVRDDGPAAKAGLKGGDIIVSFGGKSIGTIQDYMESTHGYKPGDQVEVVVKREGKDVKLKVTLEGRSGN